MSDLTIKINGDSSNYEDALNNAKKKTEGLGDSLKAIAGPAAVVFAAIVGEIGVAIKAFGESEQASNSLTQALQNQGIYTDGLVKKYKEYADAVSLTTGIDDDALVGAQATIQGMLGKTEVTQKLTMAIADLSVAEKISLTAAADMIGKGIQGHERALKILFPTLDENLDKQGRTAQILDVITARYGGQAEAANKGVGSIKGLTTAYQNLQEQIGEKFAPAFELVTRVLTKALNEIVAWTKDANSLWNTFWPNMVAVYAKFAAEVSAISGGIGKILSGFFHLDSGLIKEGVDQAVNHLAAGERAFNETLKASFESQAHTITEQNKRKAELAAAQAAIEEAIEARKIATIQAEQSLIISKLEKDSESVIALKAREVEILKALEDDKNAGIRDRLEANLSEVLNLELAAAGEQVEIRKNISAERLANDQAFQELSLDEQKLFLDKHLAELQKSALTESGAKAALYLKDKQDEINIHNQYLKDEAQYGEAIAKIKNFGRTKDSEQQKKALDETEAMQASHNDVIKALGKAAAIANIIIKTKTAAMNIFEGFSTIPFIGPALGIAGAAAAIAFGAEQIAGVIGAAQGGLITGGIPGIDSVPAMLTPGELVVPERNFDEVINSVSNARSGDGFGSGAGGSSGGQAEIVLSLKDGLMDFIETQIVERQKLGISILGAS